MAIIITPNRPAQTPQAAPVTSPGGPAPQDAGPTHEEIAQLAYDIYVSKGRREGQSELNWLQAEHDLRNRAEAVRQARDSLAGR